MDERQRPASGEEQDDDEKDEDAIDVLTPEERELYGAALSTAFYAGPRMGEVRAAIKRLDRAFRALVRSGEEARAAGVPASRVDDEVERARDRCRALLLDVLVPLVARKDAVCDVSRARTAHYLKGVDGV